MAAQSRWLYACHVCSSAEHNHPGSRYPPHVLCAFGKNSASKVDICTLQLCGCLVHCSMPPLHLEDLAQLNELSSVTLMGHG